MTAPELQARADAWHERQLKSIERAHGNRWPEHKAWIEDYLRAEVRQLLEAPHHEL